MSDETESLIEEMRGIKTLLMLQALAVGYKQKDLAAALGVSEATLSRMLPKGLSKASKTLGAARVASEG